MMERREAGLELINDLADHTVYGGYTLRSQVVTSKQPKLGLTQDLSFCRISESTTRYTFTPCVGSFTSPGMDTK